MAQHLIGRLPGNPPLKQLANWLQVPNARAGSAANLALGGHVFSWVAFLDFAASFQCQGASPAQLETFVALFSSVVGSFAVVALLHTRQCNR